MKHHGDITKISGYEIEPVDVITGGSPCQDLSVAGKRAGLAGERSGLFMQQIRIVKEMRKHDGDGGRTGKLIRPRYMVWENVPGALSSNGGRDFGAVLTEIIRIAEPDAPDVPLPEKGKWPKWDVYMGDGWSVAYRIHDAQYWGVPQRRRRICVLADFAGYTAGDILFDPQLWRETAGGNPDAAVADTGNGPGPEIQPFGESVPRDFEPSGTAREEAAGGLGGGAEGSSVWCLQGNGIDRDVRQNGIGIAKDVAYTLDSVDRHGVCAGFKHKASGTAGGIGYEEETAPSLISGQTAAVYDARGNGDRKIVCTITGDHENRVTDYTAICVGNGQTNNISMSEQANTLDTMHDQQAVMVAHTLKAKANCDFREDSETYPITLGTVRRLTPLEVERLQGFPDGWTDIGDWTDKNGKRHKAADAPRYKALGNSIALPFWQWLARRICAGYARTVTMGSLFDGIGGFPLAFSRCGAVPVWASEIEPFCVAVTKKHFGE